MQTSGARSSLTLTESSWNSHDYQLRVIQEPLGGRATGRAEKTRGASWPIDPPPVVEFKINDGDRSQSYLQSPFWFCTAELIPLRTTSAVQSNILSGCSVSSLHKVRLQDNLEHGLFIFGDLNARAVGEYYLRFTLYEMRHSGASVCAAKLASARSKDFRIISPKEHANNPHRESTALSRTLCEAGVKLRIRKESSKRKSQTSDWAADKRHALMAHGPASSSGSMGPPQWPSLRQQNNSEDISHRLSFQKQELGIRTLMDQQNHHTVAHAATSSPVHYQSQQPHQPSFESQHHGQGNFGALSLPLPMPVQRAMLQRPAAEYQDPRHGPQSSFYRSSVSQQETTFDMGQMSQAAPFHQSYLQQPALPQPTNGLYAGPMTQVESFNHNSGSSLSHVRQHSSYDEAQVDHGTLYDSSSALPPTQMYYTQSDSVPLYAPTFHQSENSMLGYDPYNSGGMAHEP